MCMYILSVYCYNCMQLFFWVCLYKVLDSAQTWFFMPVGAIATKGLTEVVLIKCNIYFLA